VAERQEPQAATAPDEATGPLPSVAPAYAHGPRPGPDFGPQPAYGPQPALGAQPAFGPQPAFGAQPPFGMSPFGAPAGYGTPQRGFGPGFGAVPEQPGEAQMRPPSGLFPGQPPRPVYREPHPVRSGPLLAGLASAILWFVLFGTLGRDLASYAWWTIVAGITAWAVSVVLAVFGDRGVAVGIALASGFGLSIAMGVVTERWITTDNWPLPT
jgi:hypothetical protein